MFWYNLFIVLLALIVTSSTFVYLSGAMPSGQLEWLLFANGVIPLTILIFKAQQQRFSLAFIYGMFGFVFFYLTPLAQLTQGLFMYNLNSAALLDNMATCLMLSLLFHVGYISTYVMVFRRMVLQVDYRLANPQWLQVKSLVFVACAVLFLLAVIGAYGVNAITIRSGLKGLYETSQIAFLIFTKFIIPYTLIVFLAAYIIRKNYGSHYIGTLLFGLMATTGLLYNIPTAQPRFYAFAILMMLFAVFLSKKARRAWIFVLSSPLAVGLGFFLNRFRHVDDFSEGFADDSKNITLVSGNFDAFEMFMNTIHYVDENGYMLGKNFLGAVLFFVPRALWPGKPIGSGSIVLTKVHSADFLLELGITRGWSNVSCPLVAEFYLAGGAGMVLLGGLLIGFMCSILDGAEIKMRLSKVKGYELYKLAIAGLSILFLFNLRGDLLSSTAYIFGFLLAYFFACKTMGLSMRLRLLRLQMKNH